MTASDITPGSLQSYFETLLLTNCAGHIGRPIPKLDATTAEKLQTRIDAIRLFTHSFSFYLNLAHGPFVIADILRFAVDQSLDGASINIDIGGAKALSRMSDTALDDLRSLADRSELEIALEMSSTDFAHFEHAGRIATRLGARHIRMRSGSLGRVGDIVDNLVTDLKQIAGEAARHNWHIYFEQHEALTSREIVNIVTAVDSAHIKILFDFGNMINAGEEPLEALQIQMPLVHRAHLKGVRRVWSDDGCGQLGVPEGEDDLPQAKLMFDLLMLGDRVAQVPVFILEKVVGYASPPMRRPEDSPETVISHRAPSTLQLSEKLSVEENLMMEQQQSARQVGYIRSRLAELRTLAELKMHGS